MFGDGSADDIDPLTRLAIRHGTDKWGTHFYTPIYHALFSPLRRRSIRLLEIGTGGYNVARVGGASLSMWADYFPNGQITGIDIAEKKLSLDPRITLLRGSQSDTEFLTRVCDEHGPFDIVIDDGSHVPQDSAVSFHSLFPRMAGAGLYIIEDIQTWYFPRYGGSLRADGSPAGLLTSLFENLNHAEIKIAEPGARFDDIAKQIRSLRTYHNLLVVEKGDNTEPSNFDYSASNPHAVRALRWIREELERAPTPEGFANLVATYTHARAFAQAQTLCDEVLKRWPGNLPLLMAALSNADKSGDLAGRLSCLEALLLADPDGGWRWQIEETKAKLLAAGATTSECASITSR